MCETHKKTLKLIQCRIISIEKHSELWGSPETLESLMLTLVELRSFLVRPIASKKDPFEVAFAWARFTESVSQKPTKKFLFAIVEENGYIDRLPEWLGDVARWILVELPPEG